MEIREYTLAEIRDFIRYLQGIYDRVRLVDPVECKEIMTGEDGVWAGPDCYAVWGGRSRCRNCTSYEARRTGRRRTRDEMLDGRTVHIQSVPIRLWTAERSISSRSRSGCGCPERTPFPA